MIEKVTTNEGTTIIVDSTAATSVAAVGILYDFGSRDEDFLLQGCTHFIEHMLFKGTLLRSPFQISQGIDRLGGKINATTDRESVRFFSAIPLESFDYAAETLIDIINNAALKPDGFEKERIVIENELLAADDDLEKHVLDDFYEKLWGNHQLGREICGTNTLLANLKYEEVFKVYINRFKSRPHLVSIAGDIFIDHALRLFSGKFQQSADKIQRIQPGFPSLGAPYYKSASHQKILVFCSFNNYFTLSIPEYYALLIANTAQGDSMSSRLFQALREKLGLCYNINSMLSLFSDLTEWTIYASTTHESISKFLNAIINELHSIIEFGFTDIEILDTRNHIIGSMKFDSIDIEYRMHRIAHQWLYGTNPISIEKAAGVLEKITDKEVNSIVKRFMGNGVIIFGVGPARSEIAFCKAAQKLASIF